MSKKLPPIFKVSSNNIPSNNKKYYYSKSDVKSNIQEEVITEEKSNDVEEVIDKIFNTRGYSFNIPVEINFAGKSIETNLAARTSNSIITLENLNIPISTINKITIKDPIK